MPLAPWEEPSIVQHSLESLVVQQPAAQRIVISVDGSLPDALTPIIQRCTSVPILVLQGPGQEGVGRVLARGLLACRCEVILRADADDVSCPNRAARQLAWLVEHPEVVAGSGWIDEFVAEPSVCVVSRRRVPSNAGLAGWSRWRNPLNHPAVVFRRSAVLAVGGYRHQPGFEDYDLWLRLLKSYGAQSLNNLPEVLVMARVGPAHLGRRKGFHYAAYEFRFLFRCAQEGHLPWQQVLILCAIRLPLRLLPAWMLGALMRRLRSSFR